MSNLSPHKIIGGFNRRESRAVGWIYRAYYPTVLELVLKLVGEDCPDAEDLTGEAFLRLLDTTARFERIARIRSFLFNTARNLCTRYQEHKEIAKGVLSARVILDQTLTDDRDYLESHERFMSQIFLALKKLPKKQSLIFRMAYIDGLTNDQIAARLQLSEKTIANSKINSINSVKAIIGKALLLILLNILL